MGRNAIGLAAGGLFGADSGDELEPGRCIEHPVMGEQWHAETHGGGGPLVAVVEFVAEFVRRVRAPMCPAPMWPISDAGLTVVAESGLEATPACVPLLQSGLQVVEKSRLVGAVFGPARPRIRCCCNTLAA